MKLDKKVLGYSVAIGLIMTLVSSFFTNNYIVGEFPQVQIITIPILGVSYYGHPLPWMRQVVYPGAPTDIVWSHLVIDLVLWTILILLLNKFYFKGKSSRRLRSLKSRAKKKVGKKRPAKRKASKRPSRRKR